nr:hypothetical protein Iba_chr15eCG7050 [Ipomoea batatas]
MARLANLYMVYCIAEEHSGKTAEASVVARLRWVILQLELVALAGLCIGSEHQNRLVPIGFHACALLGASFDPPTGSWKEEVELETVEQALPLGQCARQLPSTYYYVGC